MNCDKAAFFTELRTRFREVFGREMCESERKCYALAEHATWNEEMRLQGLEELKRLPKQEAS